MVSCLNVAMKKLPCLIVVVASVWLHCSAQLDDRCSPADPECDLIPSEREYHCSISATNFEEQVYNDCRPEYIRDPENSPCVVYAGMAVYMQCNEDSNMTLYVHTDDGEARFLGRNRWMSPYVGREHEGLYGCRFQNDTVYGYRNLSVQGR